MIPSGQTPVGRLLRWPLRFIPEDLVVPVLTGPNRGLRWVVGASTHGCWIGTYEQNLVQALKRRIREGAVFYDLGANVGYYALLGARSVGPTGEVVAVEPLPRNLAYLRRHVSLNDLANVRVVPAAVGDRNGTIDMEVGKSPSQAKVATDGGVRVSARSLDSLDLPPPDVIKMDVEGSELSVLRGASDTLDKHSPVIVFSTHGEELRTGCYEMLAGMGYRVERLGPGSGDHIAEPPS